MIYACMYAYCRAGTINSMYGKRKHNEDLTFG